MSTAILKLLGVALFGVSGLAAAYGALVILDSGWRYTGLESDPEVVNQILVTRPYSGSVLALAVPIVLSLGGAVAAGTRRLLGVACIPVLMWLFSLVTGFSIGGAFVATSVLASIAAVVSIVDIWLWRRRHEHPAL